MSIMLSSIRKNSISIILSLFVSFCCVGNRCFLYPIDKQVCLKDVFLFILVCIAVFPILKWILSINFTKYLYQENKYDRSSKSIILLGIFLFFLLSIVEITYVVAFYPGCVSWDFQMELAQALGYEPIDYQLNPLIMVLIRVIYIFKESVTALIFVQCLVINLIITSICVEAYQRGIKKKFLIIMVIIFMLLPNNPLMLITLSKDVTYACGFLGVLLVLVKWIVPSEKNSKNRYVLFLETALCLALISYSRYNGILVAFCIIIALLVMFKSKRNLLTMILICVFLVCIGLPLKNMAEVNNGQGTMYVGMTQDMFGVYYAGGDLSSDAIDYLESIVDLEAYRTEYTPYWTYWESWTESFHTNNETKTIDFIKIYIDTFIRNPIKLMRCVLCRIDPIWGITKGIEGYETWIWKTKCSRYDFYPIMYPDHRDNALSNVLNIYGEYSQRIPFRLVCWRNGLWFVISLILLVRNIKYNKRIVLLWIPLISQIASMAAANGWSHYRYYWSIEVYVFWLIVAVISIKSQTEKVE